MMGTVFVIPSYRSPHGLMVSDSAAKPGIAKSRHFLAGISISDEETENVAGRMSGGSGCCPCPSIVRYVAVISRTVRESPLARSLMDEQVIVMSPGYRSPILTPMAPSTEYASPGSLRMTRHARTRVPDACPCWTLSSFDWPDVTSLMSFGTG